MKGSGLRTNKLFSTDVYHLIIQRLWTYMLKELILNVELELPSDPAVSCFQKQYLLLIFNLPSTVRSSLFFFCTKFIIASQAQFNVVCTVHHVSVCR